MDPFLCGVVFGWVAGAGIMAVGWYRHINQLFRDNVITPKKKECPCR